MPVVAYTSCCVLLMPQQAPSPVNVKSARAAANKSKGSTGRSQGSSHDSTKKMPPKHGSQASAPSAPGTASSSSRTTSSKRGDAPARAEQGNTWTPAQVLKTRPGELTEYEQGEILEYKQVYFWVRAAGLALLVRISLFTVAILQGNTSKKIRANTRAPNNHGFDDERGDYKLVMRDHLAYVPALGFALQSCVVTVCWCSPGIDMKC